VLSIPRRVLIVDDHGDTADTTSVLLKMEGHEVQCAYDGLAAIELAKLFRPEIVLLDVAMPGLDGYAVARALRALQDWQPARLVAVTGWAREEDKNAAMAAGFDLHLPKPVRLETLLAVLQLE
jgi:CheY-like chemotaxis protein